MGYEIEQRFGGRKVTAIDEISEIKSINEQQRSIVVCCSAEVKDRMGDIIMVGQGDSDGIILDDYRSNPVVQFAHQYSEAPVGTCDRIWKTTEGGVRKLMASIKFHEFSEKAELVWNLMKAKILKGISIGFLPLEQEDLPEKDSKKSGLFRRGVRYTKSTLLELSTVPVPANQLALSTLKGYVAKGLIPEHCIGSDSERDRILRAEGITADMIQGMVQRVIRRLDYEAALEKVAQAIEDDEFDDDWEEDDLDLEDNDFDIEDDEVDLEEAKELIEDAVRVVLGRLD